MCVYFGTQGGNLKRHLMGNCNEREVNNCSKEFWEAAFGRCTHKQTVELKTSDAEIKIKNRGPQLNHRFFGKHQAPPLVKLPFPRGFYLDSRFIQSYLSTFRYITSPRRGSILYQSINLKSYSGISKPSSLAKVLN